MPFLGSWLLLFVVDGNLREFAATTQELGRSKASFVTMHRFKLVV
jgi:hypothetical protein